MSYSNTAPITSTEHVREDARLPNFLPDRRGKVRHNDNSQIPLPSPKHLMSDPKEPDFFSQSEGCTRGLAWYHSLFAGAAPSQLCGEASTTYTRWPHTEDAAAQIADLLPNAKLIYIVRHPVERAYSHYAHHMREGVTKTFEQAIADDAIYVDCSMYMRQIERYLRHYDSKSILCVLTEDLETRPRATLDAILDFMGWNRSI